MRPGTKTLLGATLVAPGVITIALGWNSSFGEEPSRLARLFRFGGSSSSSSSAPASTPTPAPASTPGSTAPGGLGTEFSEPHPVGPEANGFPAPTASNASPAGPRLVPQPRVSRSATESDPIVTRISLARSNDGNQFGMFLQVYADGTVIDSDGVHHASDADMKPLTDALAASELYRTKGHCGSPATDFVEQVHVVVYERSLGRLRANSFSYSGNTQGCDHTVKHLHAALDNLQGKFSRMAAPSQATAGPAFPNGTPAAPAAVNPTGPTISLTPIN